jgi:hypothetical protein
MSGGSHDYVCRDLEWKARGKMYDAELNELIDDLIDVLHDVEWWQSGDYGEEDYRETVQKFKKKWFGNKKSKRRAELIVRECERLKKELLRDFGEYAEEMK